MKAQRKTLLYSGGVKHECEVGFVIRDNIAPNIVRFKPISDRLCYIELNCKWYNMFLINCYVPTENKSGNIKNIFYKNLDLVYDILPNDKPKIVLRDFNAKIGKETSINQQLDPIAYMLLRMTTETN